MRYIKDFLIKRKQSDVVKLITLFVLAGMVMLGMTMQKGIALYKLTKQLTEYVFMSGTSGGVTENQIYYIQNLEYVEAVSRQYETELVLGYMGTELILPCRMLSREYIENIYGQSTLGMQTFYVNQAAYKEMQNAGWCSYVADENEEHVLAGILPEYNMDGLDNGVARLELEPQIFGDEGMSSAVGATDKATLSEHPEMIRVAVTENDLTGENLRNLEKSGVVLVNETEANRVIWEQQAEYLRLKYEAVITILCFVAAWSLKKYSGS
ncbi:MAG: hypothetical protein K2G45_11075 [Lachnospiraceae bacterium]|nr:hypothetical protein [Lachnospiraceae bacterium]